MTFATAAARESKLVWRLPDRQLNGVQKGASTSGLVGVWWISVWILQVEGNSNPCVFMPGMLGVLVRLHVTFDCTFGRCFRCDLNGLGW